MLSPAPEMPSFEATPTPSVSDPVEMGNQVRERVNSSLYEMAVKRAREERVKLVTFGHTHDAGSEPLPDGGVYINSGTWTWRADFGEAGKKTWKDLFRHPERFTNDRRLSYVRIDYDGAGQPIGQLLEYELQVQPGPTPSPVTSPSLWERIVNWLRGVWASILGKE